MAPKPKKDVAGIWDYSDTDRQAYGETTMYELGANWLEDCETVEDWGTGFGYFKNYRPDAIGVDASPGHADVIADLTTYTSEVEGIMIRAVLEHNLRWKEILENVMKSATKKVALILFTPMEKETRVRLTNGRGIPDISFSEKDLESHFDGWEWSIVDLKTYTVYGVERAYLLGKKNGEE